MSLAYKSEKKVKMNQLSKKVFVADDDKFHLELMEHILQSQGVDDIQLFESGMDCLKEIHQQPEIIFLDHHMDVYSGYETLRKIKRYNPNIFVVMISGQEDIQTAVNVLKHGAFDYLVKDEKLEENIVLALRRIEDIKALLQTRKPSFIKNLLSII